MHGQRNIKKYNACFHGNKMCPFNCCWHRCSCQQYRSFQCCHVITVVGLFCSLQSYKIFGTIVNNISLNITNVFLHSCLITHYAKRMHSIILSSVLCLAVSYFYTLPHKLLDFRETIFSIKFEILFSLHFLFEIYFILRIIQEHKTKTKLRGLSPRANYTASVVQWSEFLATDTEVPGSIPGATRFSEQQWVWNGVHSAS